jgi:hypothetical protein
MTFFTPPAVPVDTAPRKYAQTPLDAAIYATGRVDLDHLVGTNSIVAPSRGQVIYVLPESSTVDGSSFTDVRIDQRVLVGELRARTGLSYGRLARLLGVERRSLYFWIEGRAISSDNLDRLTEVTELCRSFDRGNPAETAERLLHASPDAAALPKVDRLAGLRISESDEAARFPVFDVATLLGSGSAEDDDTAS